MPDFSRIYPNILYTFAKVAIISESHNNNNPIIFALLSILIVITVSAGYFSEKWRYPAPLVCGEPNFYSYEIGISRLMDSSSDMSVSVPVTPGIICILSLSSFMRCSLSRA